MFKYIAFAAAFASIGKAALDCDGALVDGTTAWIAGACTVSSTPDLTVSYQQKCTDTDLIQYFYDNEECLGEPTSSTTVCTGPNAVGSCEITCDGTPCVYVESVVETDVIECDGTMVLNATELVIDAKLLDFCILQGNSSQMYTELNGDIMIDFYDTMNCSGAAVSVTLEDRCSDVTGFASSYSIQTAMRTMDPIPQPLECDGAVVTKLDGDEITTSAYIAGACTVSSTPSLTTSYMQICTDDGDVVQVFYDNADCSGDITSTSASVCSGAISCDISCRGIPCDYVATKVESGFTECAGLSAVEPTQFVVQPNPLNYCVYNLERDTSSQYTVENGGIVWNVYHGVVDCRGDGIPIEEEDTCSVENGGSAISYVTGTAVNTVVEPLGCDGAIVTEIENGTINRNPYIAGACTVSSSPNLTVSFMQQCTEDDVIQYVFDNADCSGDPVSSSSVCTGDNAMGSCVITCTGTPCDYVEITVEYGLTECDGTSPVDPTTTVVQPFPLNYCSYDAEQDKSTEYVVELDGNIVYNTYDGEGCSGDPTFSSIQEDTCSVDFGGFAISATVRTAEYTMVGEGPPEPLGCDGAVVTELQDGVITTSAYIAGACMVSSTPALTTSYMQRCTADGDVIQYFYSGTTDCSGDPTSSSASVCSGAISCEITCTGTPCDYVEDVVVFDVTECDGTMVLNSTGFVADAKLLDFCMMNGDSSKTYTESNGDIMINFYGTTDCSGAATSVALEDRCDDVTGSASSYSLRTAIDTVDTMSNTSEPMGDELGCDGTIVFGVPIVAGTCQVNGDSSVWYECAGDDIIASFYNESMDCSGDAAESQSLCTGDGGLGCTVSCDGTPCDAVTIMSYENVTECNVDGTPVDGTLSTTAIPLGFCLYGLTFTSDDGSSIIQNYYGDSDCSGDPSISIPVENICDAADGSATMYYYDAIIMPETTEMPLLPEALDCDGAATIFGPFVAGTCLSFGNEMSVMMQCNDDDVIGFLYNGTTDCSGDIDAMPQSLCMGEDGIPCTVTCTGTPCEVVTIMSYEGVTMCNDDGTPADGMLTSQWAQPLDNCILDYFRGTSSMYTSDGSSVMMMNYTSDDCSGDADVDMTLANVCNVDTGSAIVYMEGSAANTTTNIEVTPSPTMAAPEYVLVVSTCPSTEDCTGSDCETEEIPISDVCRNNDDGTSYTGSCIGDVFTYNVYFTDDCSGDATTVSLTVGECTADGSGGSGNTACELMTATPTTAAPTTAEPTTAPTENPTMEPTTGGDTTDGQYRIEYVVSATFVCFVLSFLA